MRTVVIFSGGQDSTTCLLRSLQNGEKVVALTFDYGQKNKVEIDCAKRICSELGVPQRVMNVSDIFRQISDTPYVGDGVLGGKSKLDNSLPATWVPNRNMMFITMAHSFALKLGYDKVVTGVNAVDYSGYPDCRPAFISSLKETLHLSVPSKDVELEAPLLGLSKVDIWKMAYDLNGIQTIKELTHTCYNGDHVTKNEWGYGCGECDSCKIRKESYERFLLTL